MSATPNKSASTAKATEPKVMDESVKQLMAMLAQSKPDGGFSFQGWANIGRICGISIATAKQRFGRWKEEYRLATEGADPPPPKIKRRQSKKRAVPDNNDEDDMENPAGNVSRAEHAPKRQRVNRSIKAQTKSDNDETNSEDHDTESDNNEDDESNVSDEEKPQPQAERKPSSRTPKPVKSLATSVSTSAQKKNQIQGVSGPSEPPARNPMNSAAAVNEGNTSSRPIGRADETSHTGGRPRKNSKGRTPLPDGRWGYERRMARRMEVRAQLAAEEAAQSNSE